MSKACNMGLRDCRRDDERKRRVSEGGLVRARVRDVLTSSSKSQSLRMSLRRPHSTARVSARAVAENWVSLTLVRSKARGGL